MKKLLIIPMIALAITACEPHGTTKSGGYEFKDICVDGVVYISRHMGFKSGVMSVKFGTDSKVILCDVK